MTPDSQAPFRRLWRAATEPVRIRDREHAVKVGASYLIAAVEVPVGAALHAIYGWWMVAFFAATMLVSMAAVITWSAWQEARGAWRQPKVENGCECGTLRSNEYRGRDGWWRCFECDRRVEKIDA